MKRSRGASFRGRASSENDFDRSAGGTQRDLREIVGVVRDASMTRSVGPPPTIYLPLRGQGGATLTVRAADAGRIAPLLRQEILRADPSVKVSRVMLQTTLIDNLLVRDQPAGVVVWLLWYGGPPAGGHRLVWRAQLFGRATHEGDRHSHGFRCKSSLSDPVGDHGDCYCRCARGCCGLGGRIWFGPLRRQPVV